MANGDDPFLSDPYTVEHPSQPRARVLVEGGPRIRSGLDLGALITLALAAASALIVAGVGLMRSAEVPTLQAKLAQVTSDVAVNEQRAVGRESLNSSEHRTIMETQKEQISALRRLERRLGTAPGMDDGR